MRNIYVNGDVYTMNEKNKRADAIVTDGKFILYAGSNEGAMRFQCPGCRLTDLNGKLVVPGFNDSHMHLLSYGAAIGMRINLGSCHSFKEMIAQGKAYVSERNIPEGSWIMGRGWNQENFTDLQKIPDRYDLDSISEEYPLYFVRSCNTVISVNSKVLQIMGLNKGDALPEGLKAFDDGTPSGIFEGQSAVDLLYSYIPEVSVDEIKYMIELAVADALSKGLTSCQTDDFETFRGWGYDKILRAYDELKREGKLKLRIYEQCRFNRYEDIISFLEADFNTGQGDDIFKIGPVKIIADGGLTYRTAYLNEPYVDDMTTRGETNYSQEQIDTIAQMAAEKDMQMAAHCIGDKAIDMVLDAYEKAYGQDNLQESRCSIIHCQITSDDNLGRMRDLKVIAQIQPVFINYDWHIAAKRLGEERLSHSYCWKRMLDEGIIAAFGTDCPVEDLKPVDTIYSAVTRKDLSGRPDGGWLPEQKLNVYDSVYCYTVNSAYASFEENIKGTIEPGKLADFVVFEDNIFYMNLDNIKDARVHMTVFDGEQVYVNGK